jgi:hypothetical protein
MLASRDDTLSYTSKAGVGVNTLFYFNVDDITEGLSIQKDTVCPHRTVTLINAQAQTQKANINRTSGSFGMRQNQAVETRKKQRKEVPSKWW